MPGRRAYLFVAEGALSLDGRNLETGDVAKVTGETSLRLEAGKPAEIVLMDLP